MVLLVRLIAVLLNRVGQGPLSPKDEIRFNVNSPCHLLAKHGFLWAYFPLTTPFRGMLLTETERPALLSPTGSSATWYSRRGYRLSPFAHSITALHGAPIRSW